jgi:hypothetical protein
LGIAGSLLSMVGPTAGERVGLLTPAVLGAGAILILVGCWLLAASAPPSTPRPFVAVERGAVAIAAALVVLALWSIVHSFASAVADNRAQTTAAELWASENSVIVDTSERLIAPSSLIHEETVEPIDPALGLTFRYKCFRALAVRGDRWVLVPARWTPEFGYAVIMTASSSRGISTQRLEGIADTAAADWEGDWQCPEVAPARAQAASG